MLLSWLLFPALLLALCAGCGLLVRRLSGVALPAALVAPVGFTVVVLVGEMASIDSAFAELAAPVTVAVAVAGFLLSRGVRRDRLERWALWAAMAVFVVYAAPVVASGDPTFTGYIKLDDTATWLALTDRIAEAGRDLSGLGPSTYEATLHFNLGSGYPIGAFTPLAIGSTILGRDPAWLFQPYLATMAALLALCLYQLASEVVRRPPLRAAIAFLAAQPALLFGYYLWGGVKEVAGALLLALLAALLPAAVSTPRLDWRAALPPALAAAATLALLTAAGATVWLLPMLLLGALAVALRHGVQATLIRLALVTAAALLVSLPWLLDAGLLPRESGALTDPGELGNLIGSLSPWQAVGIWPSGDFRIDPADTFAATLLIAVALGAAILGLARIWARRALGPAAFIAGFLVGAAVLVAIGSPWVGGKALATCAPAVLFAACVGATFLWERGLRVEGGVVLGLIALGVLWSNALGYREAFLAPFDRLSELEAIGERIDGQGPTLMTEYEPYGARHFLREGDPESASELRRRVVPLTSGAPLDTGETADIDRFALSGLLEYETLVLRRAPFASRPPLPFQLSETGDDYEVWQAGGSPAPLVHLPLGEGNEPAATPSCEQIRQLAREPGALHLAAAVRPAPIVIPMSQLSLPAEWTLGGDGSYATPTSPGIAEGEIDVSQSGEYGVWLGGSLRGKVEIAIDGEPVADAETEIDHAAQYREIGAARLAAGRHRIALSYEEPSPLAPGAGGERFAVGPLALSLGTAADARVEVVGVEEADSLCGRPLDWVEALPY
ncbi:MAG TPA: hypothetical protein VFM51_11385 [Solirubrobacterales bacterium]|nr:hypothetical protein [Solirubrobacterales bacterium]